MMVMVTINRRMSLVNFKNSIAAASAVVLVTTNSIFHGTEDKKLHMFITQGHLQSAVLAVLLCPGSRPRLPHLVLRRCCTDGGTSSDPSAAAAAAAAGNGAALLDRRAPGRPCCSPRGARC